MTPTSWHFRPARPSDAETCARLTFDSGPAEMRFFLPGESQERCIAFLRFGFISNHGMFSWRNHYVACTPDDAVHGELGVYAYRHIRFDNLYLMWTLLRFFGPLKFFRILRRAMILEQEQPSPERGQVLIRCYSVDKCAQSSKIARMMFEHAIFSGWLPFTPDHQYLLNVRQDSRARHLYERLGFVVQPRQRPPSARLPAELVSVRMVWSEAGMASARKRAVLTYGPLAQKPATAQEEHRPMQPVAGD